MWYLVLLVCITNSEQQTLSQVGNRVILKNSNNPSDPCEGHVKIYHNKTWGYVGDEGWTRATEEVVCKSTHCGRRVDCSAEDIIPIGSKIWLNEMNCTGKEEQLWDCSPPGWGISIYQKYTVKKVKCSNKVNITLDGFRCAGAVQYTSGSEFGYICADNWGQTEADHLCKSLSCGKSKAIPQHEWMVWKRFWGAPKMMIQCSDIGKDIDHLWQCASRPKKCTKPAFVVCEDYEKLQLSGNTSNVCSGMLKKEVNGKWQSNNIKTSPDLWCQQMYCGTKMNQTQKDSGTEVTCSDKVSVQLVDRQSRPSKCYGRVSILRNNVDYSVCSTKWNALAADVVCKELNCGKVIVAEGRPAATRASIMDNVNCVGNEASLWHCQAKHHQDLDCQTFAHVVCEKSLDVRLIDGPGRCAGRVEIWYKGEWTKVSTKGWTDNNSNSVCRQLKCGDKRDAAQAERFSQGSGQVFPKTVDCKTRTSLISECVKDSILDQIGGEIVGVTCEDHMVIFLNGNTSCSGLVGIEQGNKTYWLSGSKETWTNDTASLVCRQRQCGALKDFDVVSNADMKRDVWGKSLKCSTEHKSLFECEDNKAASDHKETIARVTCSGDIRVELSNGCWGHVNVSMDNRWGGTCADAWTEAKSLMLCKNLGCGDKLLPPRSYDSNFKVIVKSLHTTKETTKLSQCNFVRNSDRGAACAKGPAFVVCSGSVQTRLKDTRDNCSGNVEVLYQGQWLPVCQEALDGASTQNAICQEQECGQADKKIAYVGPAPTSVISELDCPTGLKACSVTSKRGPCTLTGLQCSKWSKKTLSDTCNGIVTHHGQSGSGFVSAEYWTKSTADSFCKGLDCGNMKTVRPYPMCSADGNQQTNNISTIECQDTPTVTLSGTCNGVVKLNGNEVCSTNWKDDYSHKVCHELGCSNAITGVALVKEAKPNAKYNHVTCDSFHHKLGQCKRHKDKCLGNLVSVSCVNSVKFNTTSYCGGKLRVNYEDDKWEDVCPWDNTPGLQDMLNKLCQAMDCGEHNISIPDSTKEEKKDMGTTIAYTGNHMNIRHAVHAKACTQAFPARIYCTKFQPPDPEETNGSIVSVMLGVGVVLILVILAAIFARIWYIKKRRKLPRRMVSHHEMEIDSGEFEQIIEREGEILTHDRFIPESEVMIENNRLSTASLSYDDIDDVGQALAAGSSGGDHLHEEADVVTYEVEDPQEGYDDVDVDPGAVQAEVHDGSQPEPDGSAAAPHTPQQDDDYLVPGQDG